MFDKFNESTSGSDNSDVALPQLTVKNTFYQLELQDSVELCRNPRHRTEYTGTITDCTKLLGADIMNAYNVLQLDAKTKSSDGEPSCGSSMSLEIDHSYSPEMDGTERERCTKNEIEFNKQLSIAIQALQENVLEMEVSPGEDILNIVSSEIENSDVEIPQVSTFDDPLKKNTDSERLICNQLYPPEITQQNVDFPLYSLIRETDNFDMYCDSYSPTMNPVNRLRHRINPADYFETLGTEYTNDQRYARRRNVSEMAPNLELGFGMNNMYYCDRNAGVEPGMMSNIQRNRLGNMDRRSVPPDDHSLQESSCLSNVVDNPSILNNVFIHSSEHRSISDSFLEQDEEHALTTIMLRNIPNKYTQSMVLDVLNDGFQKLYDFFYLPIDFKNRCNLGYAFINFTKPKYARMFKEHFNGRRLCAFKSRKVCEVSWGRVQGFKANVERYRNSAVMSLPFAQYKPLVFDAGIPRPFPAASGPIPAIMPRPRKI